MYSTEIHIFFSFFIFYLSLFSLMLQFQVNNNPIIIAFTPISKVLEQGWTVTRKTISDSLDVSKWEDSSF